MKDMLAISALTSRCRPLALLAAERACAQAPDAGAGTTPSFNFKEVAAGVDDKHYVAEGYDADVLIRWGDAALERAPPFDPAKLTRDGQARQFGYNNDYLGYFVLPGAGGPSEHGLLCVNHEYTNEELMFPGLSRQDARRGNTTPFAKMTKEIAEVEMMANGGSVLEVRKTGGKWAVVPNSKYARRITGETEMRIAGPAAGHARMKTSADPSAAKVLGMLNNCAGGRTPWGIWLTCEENNNGYFSGKLANDHREARNYRRLGIPGRWYNWGTISIASTWRRKPTRPIASDGRWRSIPSTRARCL